MSEDRDRGFQFSNRLEPNVWYLEGFIPTDSSGDPEYASDGSVLDQDGDPVALPRGLESVTRVQAGVYRFVFRAPWFKTRGAALKPYQPAVQGQRIGTVELGALTLSSLNTKTLLITTSGSGGEQTITFTTPSDVADIAVQINAGIAPDAAEIITTEDGSQYLRLFDVVLGSASSIAINATSTADTVLGVSNTASTGKDVGSTCVLRMNPRAVELGGSAAADYKPARTIDFAYVDDAGGALNMVSGGFFYSFAFVATDTVS